MKKCKCKVPDILNAPTADMICKNCSGIVEVFTFEEVVGREQSTTADGEKGMSRGTKVHPPHPDWSIE
tara:strand:+ start:2573 stop:2776 length:204 start_codon:yes stop_codon:yes gene_type:complete